MISFNSLVVVGAVAVAVPLFLGLAPAVKVHPVVLEILGGILVGPAVLGWVHLDVAVRVISDLGLGFLLFIAGYEIDLRQFGRRMLSLAGRAFVASAALAVLIGYGLQLGGQVKDGLLIGITLMATALGILVPIIKDAGQAETDFGRLIMTAGSLAEIIPLVLLSVFFSASSASPGTDLGLLAGFIAFTAVVVVVTQRVRSVGRLRQVVDRLESTSSQLRTRLAITFALAFALSAEHFGLATIFGAFLAGIIVRRTDESPVEQQQFQAKLEAIGFGFLIPVFFVSTGAGLDVSALFGSTRAIVLVPVFLIALLVVRGLPAALYARAVGRTRAWAAGLLQATSLTFIVVATVVGVETGHQVPSTATALVIAGLLSVIVYPPAALRLLQAGPGRAASAPGSGVPDPARPEDRGELPGIFTIAV
jgi:Kef-type K+ transport system membrane component KefB